MLKIEKDLNKLIPLQELQLTPVPPHEQLDLRGLILQSPEAFLSEIDYELFVVGTDIAPSDSVQTQCDLLGLDEQGRAVVVIIERADEKSALVRGITCAGLISRWRQDDFLRLLSDERIQQLGAYLAVDTTAVNPQQRVVFVAESPDFESLTATNWLNGRGIDVASIRVSRAASFQADGDYLWCRRATTAEAGGQSLVLEEGESGFAVRVAPVAEREAVSPQHLREEIEARKNAEEALRASEERYWTLAKLSPVGIFHTDAQGNLLYVNDRWCEMAGLTPQEAQGQGWARGLHSDDRDRVLNDWHDTTEQGLPFKAEFRFQRPDGGTSWVLGEAAVQKDQSEQVTGYVGTVTELHRVDAAGSSGPLAAGRR